jgi:hypothetical protein
MTPLRIFVRRGALRRFHRLKQDSEGLPIKVEWDRRHDERPGGTPPATGADQQRRTERRREPPFTWRTAEFVVANDPDAADRPDTNDVAEKPDD